MRKVKYINIWSLMTLLFCLSASVSAQQVPAFPGAEGAGKYTTGGRGGYVYTVSNLNDDGPGSLRDGIQKKGSRYIVFAVSGYIDLRSELVVNNKDLTIAGQTSPGSGICLRRYGFRVNADNVIIRYLRVRPGDVAKIELDAFTARKHKNIMIDHCSFSWATDEVCSVYDNENTTLQWCIISEGLNASVHSKGDHGYGGIWGGMNTTFHHNLLMNNMRRNPRLQGSRVLSTPETEKAEVMNNVIFNWGGKAIYAGEDAQYIIRNNYFKPGPSTAKSARRRLIQPYAPYGQFSFSGNVLHEGKEITKDNLVGVQMDKDSVAKYFVLQEKSFSDFKPESAQKAYKRVLKHVGASLVRDGVDRRLIAEMQGAADELGPSIIDSQTDVGGWPALEEISLSNDSDKDGMSDEWERVNGLNPNDAADANGNDKDKSYTNIEYYLNSFINL
ncbi:MAG: pectate lyase [Bacteroidales bacterium]|jgi:pectate lyase|nr:pectate lyase [Bacteroidales bacterium]